MSVAAATPSPQNRSPQNNDMSPAAEIAELALMRRFNWMGEAHSVTSLENIALMRDNGSAGGAAAKGRHRNREQRQRVIREVRCYLDQIKREIHKTDQECQEVGAADSGLHRELSPEEEAAEATLNLSCMVRGITHRQGKVLVSYFDGTSHNSIEELDGYNQHCYEKLLMIIEDRKRFGDAHTDGADAELPPQLAAQVKEAQEIVVPTPAEMAITTEDRDKLRGTDAHAVQEVRDKYNTKALEKARELLSFNIVRNADLYVGYRSAAVSRRTSLASSQQFSGYHHSSAHQSGEHQTRTDSNGQHEATDAAS